MIVNPVELTEANRHVLAGFDVQTAADPHDHTVCRRCGYRTALGGVADEASRTRQAIMESSDQKMGEWIDLAPSIHGNHRAASVSKNMVVDGTATKRSATFHGRCPKTKSTWKKAIIILSPGPFMIMRGKRTTWSARSAWA